MLFLLFLAAFGQCQNTPACATWQCAQGKAQAIVDQLSPQDLNKLLYTSVLSNSSCATIPSLPSHGFPGLCLNDGPAGARGTDFVNAYASGVSVASSWNRDMIHQRAVFMGAEFKRKGAQVVFGPTVDSMGRVVLAGRNWEGFGPDPYLSGQVTALTVDGLQQSVIATVKHFVAYEQETYRFPRGFTPGDPNGKSPSISSNVDDATLHELYMWPFQDAVHANVGSVMCSYNRINQTYACENDYTLNQILKGEFAFPGYVVSDAYAAHSGTKSAKAGLDLALAGSSFWQNGQLATAVQNGTLPKSRLSDMAKRILASWFKIIGPETKFPVPGIGFPPKLLNIHTIVDGRNPASADNILQQAIEGHVLVKNVNKALPLRSPRMLSLYGYDATVPKVYYPDDNPYGNWAFGLSSANISSTTILEAALGGTIVAPGAATLGTIASGGGSGSIAGSYISEPYSELQQQAKKDGTYLAWDVQSLNPNFNPASDAAIVLINEDASEGADRPSLADPDSDTLVKNVAAKCPNTIVVIHNAGTRLVDAWIENPNITAVIFAHLPGQANGEALVNILYGQVSPSGKLPYTVAKSASDYGNLLKPSTDGSNDSNPTKANPQSNFTEGTLIDYRRFLANNIQPRYPFGYGLTYTTFAYSGLTASWSSPNPAIQPPNPKTTIPGGIASLFDTIATASFAVNNTGSVPAAEVGQLYVQFPGETNLRHLRGFDKQLLQPGAEGMFKFGLTRRDLSRWNSQSKRWELQTGTYTLHGGPNVLDIPLTTTLKR